MFEESAKWKELKTKFFRDFVSSEQIFFIKKARECVNEKGYPVSEDLFNYCYFLTVKERLGLIDTQGGWGVMRFMLVESRREVEAELRVLERRLEEEKMPRAGGEHRLLEFFKN